MPPLPILEVIYSSYILKRRYINRNLLEMVENIVIMRGFPRDIDILMDCS